MEATLSPRQYKIEHSTNDYIYYVQWTDGKWAIRLGDTSFYLTEKLYFDYYGHSDESGYTNTGVFDTPEAALAFWKEYINKRK